MSVAERLDMTEAAIVAGYAEGLSEDEIAERLGVSRTAVHHRGRRIRDKLYANNRAEAVAIWERYRRSIPVMPETYDSDDLDRLV